MNRPKWILLVLCLVWWFLWIGKIVSLNADRDQQGSIHVSSGYRETVALFIKHDWLRFDPATRRISKNFDENSPMDKFYKQSFLQRDVAAFNRGNHNLFRIENDRIIGADPYAHNILLPFNELDSWRGSLTYRPVKGTLASLKGKGLTISLREPTSDLSRRADIPEVSLFDISQVRKDTRVPGEAVDLFGAGRGARTYLGKTHLVGRNIIFNNRERDNLLDVSINGVPIDRGRRARLDSGDLLKFEWKQGNQSHYNMLYSTVTEDAPVIAGFRSVNGKWRHMPKEVEPPFMADLVRALNNSFRSPRNPASRDANDFDLALTLDESLQDKVQTRLVAYCRSLRGKSRSALDRPPFRAAITVMDAKTGELLALASYPEAEDLGRSSIGSSRNRLLRNHNFSRLAIGSVAKVFWSAAILHEEPRLAGLKIRGYAGGEFESLLGIRINPDLDDHTVYGGEDQWVDFNEFIKYSSNRYSAILLTLATGFQNGSFSAAEPVIGLNARLEHKDQFMIGDRLYNERPPLLLKLTNIPDSNEVRSRVTSIMEFGPHARALFELFDVPVTLKDRPYGEGRGDDLLDTTIWLPLLEHLYGQGGVPLHHPFYGLSPERENLAYNLIDNFRTQYISMVLGGGDSTWTNIKTCTAFSRLVVGKKIEPALINRIEGASYTLEPEYNGDFPGLGMEPRARRILLDAMVRVTDPGGTAGKLNKLLRDYNKGLGDDKVLGFFSKTGSPTNITFLPGHTDKVMKHLIRTGALKLGSDGKIHYRNKGPISDVSDRQTGVYSFVTWIEGNREDSRLLQKYAFNPLFVMNLCSAYNKDAQTKPYFSVKKGVLTFSKTREVKSIGGVYTFTMGIYPKRAGRGGGKTSLPRIDVNNYQPDKALTVSIVIETMGNSVKVAVPLAKQLLEDKEVLWHALHQER